MACQFADGSLSDPSSTGTYRPSLSFAMLLAGAPLVGFSMTAHVATLYTAFGRSLGWGFVGAFVLFVAWAVFVRPAR